MPKLPWFKFFAADWLSDEKVTTMTMAERGQYITLLCYHWIHGSLPFDGKDLAKLIRCQVSSKVRGCFEFDGGGRLLNKKLSTIATQADKTSERRSNAGKHGASARWNNGNAMANIMAKNAESESESESESETTMIRSDQSSSVVNSLDLAVSGSAPTCEKSPQGELFSKPTEKAADKKKKEPKAKNPLSFSLEAAMQTL